MKKKLYFLFLSLMLSSTFISAQTDTIFFRSGVQCGLTTTFFNTKTLVEGQSYSVDSYTLPSAYAGAQRLYNALVGTSFQIEDGALNENIKIDWILWNVNCGSGSYNTLPSGAKVLFNGYFLVYRKDQDGNWIAVNGDYYFQNNKEAVLNLKNSADFQAFRLAVPLYNNMINFAFTYTNGGSFNTNGISLTPPADTSDVNAYYVVRAKHFSNIVGGEKSKLTGIDDQRISGVPSDYSLKQNYPNPFNPSTSIEYSLPERSNVKLTVYNVLGTKVAELYNGIKEAGNYKVPFDASNLSSGLYIYELKTNKFTQSRKMLLLK